MKLRIWTVALVFAGIALGWSIARSQTNPVETKQAQPPTNEDARKERPLDTLDWLVGDWVNQDGERSIEFSCNFTKNGSFLLRSFSLMTLKNVRMSGMQVIAWDPANEAIRSWTFDSDGGFGEDAWSQNGDSYTIRAKYTLPDGGKASAVNVFTFVNHDTCTWKSVNREIDGELQPDVDEITLVRKNDQSEPTGGK